MAKIKNDYFKLIEQQTEFCVAAAEKLVEIVTNSSSDDIVAEKEAIHEIEHKADELHHDILTRLSTEFITPIDQEDILHLVQLIDDITDALDEVVLEIYMYHIEKMPSHAVKLAQTVSQCVSALFEATKEFKNFKKPTQLRKMLVEVNHIEGRADNEFAEAIHDLFGSTTDCKELVGGKAIYQSLESCCDLCEHAADIIEQIIMKNT